MRQFWDSSIGKKVIAGVTGLMLVGFLVGHMAGNLQVFLGQGKFDAYAHFLQGLGELLWIARGVLLAALILHIVCVFQLAARNKAARKGDYVSRKPQVSTLASLTMKLGGILIAIFVPVHIMHFTTGQLHPAFQHGGAYGNVVIGFRVWWMSLFYVVTMVFVGLHLYHGVWAGFRTLGVAKPSANPIERQLSLWVALAVAGGFILVPVSVLAGLVK